jgi:hypothetical protein
VTTAAAAVAAAAAAAIGSAMASAAMPGAINPGTTSKTNSLPRTNSLRPHRPNLSFHLPLPISIRRHPSAPSCLSAQHHPTRRRPCHLPCHLPRHLPHHLPRHLPSPLPRSNSRKRPVGARRFANLRRALAAKLRGRIRSGRRHRRDRSQWLPKPARLPKANGRAVPAGGPGALAKQ